MSPAHNNNFNFNIDTYKNNFKPLMNVNASDFKFIIDSNTIGGDIERSTKPIRISNPNHLIT